MRQALSLSADAYEPFGILIPGSQVLITNGPVHPVSILPVSFKIEVAPAVAVPAPEQGAAAHNIAPDPIEAFYFVIGVFDIINIEMLVIGPERVVADLDRASFPVFLREPDPVIKLPGILIG